MITTENLNSTFNKFNDLAASGADLVTQRNMHMLMMFALDSDFVDFNGDRLVFTKGSGPLADVEIERICGADDLGSHIAIVLPASLILLHKADGAISVYLPD